MLIIAFETNITAHIASLLIGEEFYSREDVELWLNSKGWHLRAEWYGCPLCFGTSLAFAIGQIALLISGVTLGMLWWPFAFALAVPWIGHAILKRISSNH